MAMLDLIAKNLQQRPLMDVPARRSDRRDAAVLLALTAESEPQIVLTQRAAHLNDHAGEVAFPGGMWESDDSSLLHTALRESHEEIGLLPESVNLIATLPTRATRLGVNVAPYVGLIPPKLKLQPELAELDAIFQVPLSYLLDASNLEYDLFPLKGDEYSLPCYHFAGYRIWGFTLAVLVDFLNTALATDIHLVYPDMKHVLAART